MKPPLEGARKNANFRMLTRNEHRFFKHIPGMNEDTPKRRGKISYRIPKAREDEFDRLVELSSLPTNGFITDCIFRRNRHNPAQQTRLVQILDETARLKASIEAQHLMNDDIAGELKLIRTALMSLMERRS